MFKLFTNSDTKHVTFSVTAPSCEHFYSNKDILIKHNGQFSEPQPTMAPHCL
jgi:hypothetical protein